MNTVKIAIAFFLLLVSYSNIYAGSFVCPDTKTTFYAAIGQINTDPNTDANFIAQQCTIPNCEKKADGTKKIKDRVNGCSAPIFKDIAMADFKTACDIHDLCYNTLFSPRKDCDDNFFQNMKNSCAIVHTDPNDQHSCLENAALAYSAVRGVGAGSYSRDQEWAEDAHCTGYDNPHVTFYEHNYCSDKGKTLGKVKLDQNITYHLKDPGQKKIENDEARSLELHYALQDQEIELYDNPKCKESDDYAKITIQQEINTDTKREENYRCVGSFQHDYDTKYYKIEFSGKEDGSKNALDGKVSCIRIKGAKLN